MNRIVGLVRNRKGSVAEKGTIALCAYSNSNRVYDCTQVTDLVLCRPIEISFTLR